MKDLEMIKCPHCGFENIKYTKKCTKCNYDLDTNNKSCPRCGKINANNVKKCECGYNFTRRRLPLFVLFLISALIAGLLVVFYKLNPSLGEKVFGVTKIVLIFIIVFIVLNSLMNKKHDVVVYSAENEIIKKDKSLNKMKKTSKVAVVSGIVAAVIYLCYYILSK